MVIDAQHEPLISMELWEKVQKMLQDQKKAYPKHSRRSQPIPYMLKGLVRCSACGATLACNGTTSGKAKAKCMQCCGYARGKCTVSHSVTIPRINEAFIAGLEQAVGEKAFHIVPKKPSQSDPTAVDYNKLIEVEERRLARAREAYLAEIDTIEQYAKNKTEITARIEDLKAKRDKDQVKSIDINSYTEKVAGIVEFIKRDDVSEEAKNEALHTIIETIVYEKAKGNLAIYFHDL